MALLTPSRESIATQDDVADDQFQGVAERKASQRRGRYPLNRAVAEQWVSLILLNQKGDKVCELPRSI